MKMDKRKRVENQVCARLRSKERKKAKDTEKERAIESVANFLPKFLQ